jgi:hypothetical protein
VQKQHADKGNSNHTHGSASHGPYIPSNYVPPAPLGMAVTPFSDTALQLQFNSVPTLLVTQYNVETISVPGSGGDACPSAWPIGPVASLQVVPQVYKNGGPSEPVSAFITGLLPNTAYCTYVQSVGQETDLGHYAYTTTSVATTSVAPGPPPPTVTLSIAYQPPGPGPFFTPPFLVATLTPAQDPTPYTLTWYCNEAINSSGPFAAQQQLYILDSGDWYATVTCAGPTCPVSPVAPSNTITVNFPSE